MSTIRLLLSLCALGVLSRIPGAKTQDSDCPMLQTEELGSTSAPSTTGLISDSYVNQAGNNPPPPNVQLFANNIVCLAAGQMRGRYRSVSLIANFSCSGSACNNNIAWQVAQFHFECVAGAWAASVNASADFLITESPVGSLSTMLTRNCTRCIEPQQLLSPGRDTVDEATHCLPCSQMCTGTGTCFSALPAGCCNFYDRNGTCILECPNDEVPDNQFQCSVAGIIVGFEFASYSFSEDAGIVMVTINSAAALPPNAAIQVSGGSVMQPSTVIRSGPALINQTLTTLPATVSFAISDDSTALETVEEFLIILSTSDPRVAIGGPGLFGTTQISIMDNDAVTISFLRARHEFVEDTRATPAVFVQLTSQVVRPVTVRVVEDPIAPPLPFVSPSLPLINSTAQLEQPTLVAVNFVIVDDSIGFEDEEVRVVQLRVVDPDPSRFQVNLEPFAETQVAVLDNEFVRIGFQQLAYTVSEAAGTVEVCAVASFTTIRPINFTVDTQSGTALAGEDFVGGTFSSGIPANGSSGCVLIQLVLNPEMEANETFSVNLALTTMFASALALDAIRDTTTITITDSRGVQGQVICYTSPTMMCGGPTISPSPPTIQDCCLGNGFFFQLSPSVEDCSQCVVFGWLNGSTFEGHEQGQSYELQVGYAKGPSINRLFRYTLEITPTSTPAPVSGSDFRVSSAQTLRPSTTRADTVQVTFEIDSIALEPRESFSLTLLPANAISHPQTANEFLLDVIELTIVDSDVVEVEFQQPVYTVPEPNGAVTVCLESDIETKTDLQVTVTASEKTPVDAQDGLDFSSGFPQTVTFPAGVMGTTRCILFHIIDDETALENNESFNVDFDFVNGVGARKGVIPQTMVVIIDNDIFCDSEHTGLLFWPETPAGTTHTLPCPNSNTTIDRICTLIGEWSNVDISKCITFNTINTSSITTDNYDEAIVAISTAVREAVTSEQEQTADNLAIVAAVFMNSAAFINDQTSIERTTLQNLVAIVDGLQLWNADVLQENSSNIVQSFESIVTTYAQQERNMTIFRSDNVIFVAELHPLDELASTGNSFSSSDLTGTNDPDALTGNATATAFLPHSLFQSITNHSEVGTVFVIYNTGVLFPITSGQERNSSVTTVVGSAVLGIHVGLGLRFSGLVDPVRIMLRVKQQENATNERCVSWNFENEEWSTEGCQTAVSVDVVNCTCNHLTNFAVLVDICSRFEDCQPSGPLETTLEVLTIIGVVLSLFGIIATIVTLLLFKKLRQRDATKFHLQLCIALFCMLIVFVIGIDKTGEYGGCVLVSVLIHYFTLVAVMWMGAEALLMFQKLVIVFVRITTRYVTTISLVCWLLPILPVVISLIVEFSDPDTRDLLVSLPTVTQPGFCFISNAALFFGTFLGPIFVILMFNIVIFVMVIRVLIKHSRKKIGYTDQQLDRKTAIKLLISIVGVSSLFGLTWLFGALTVTGFADPMSSTTFQVFFVILNAFQGFFIFLFFCVFNSDARESWLNVFSSGYKSKSYRPSESLHTSSRMNTLKVKTACSNLISVDHSLGFVDLQRKNDINGNTLSTDNINKEEKALELPLTSAKEELAKAEDEKPIASTSEGSPVVEETYIDTDKKM